MRNLGAVRVPIDDAGERVVRLLVFLPLLVIRLPQFIHLLRKVDVRLPGEGNSNSHDARPVHLIITMIVDSDQ